MFKAAVLFIVTLVNISTLHANDVFSTDEFPKTDFSKYSVPISEIISGGPPRDGIKSIDTPKFISIEQAAKFLYDREPVVTVIIGDQAKAYPHRILLYHEIVNDFINGIPIFVTHCPLCNTAIVYKREVKNQILDFGTTGRVRNSNLVMYDRQTESWWQQFTGDAIVGYYSGTHLELIDSQIVSFRQFAENYPGGVVLSEDTGVRRHYGKTPYPGYDDISNLPFLYSNALDFRLPPLERVLAFSNNTSSVIYPFSYLSQHPLLNTTFDDKKILVISQATMVSTMDKKYIKNSNTMLTAAGFDRNFNGEVLNFEFKNNQIVDTKTNSNWNIFGEAVKGELKGAKLIQIDKNVHFSFAWLAFYPDAKIIRAE